MIKQFTAIWNKLGINQKVTIVFLLTAFVAGMGALIHLSSRPSFELLYSDLEEKDMAAVVSYLKESKIPHRITAGGKAVMVPEGQKYDLRLAMANKGTVTGSRVGLELWEAPGWGASPMAEQMMKRRAIQGELARTIMHVEQIAWADVQIAQSEQSLFAEDQRATTAAITLKLHAGRVLTPVQVAGLTRLVAGSVEGLDPKNVTVIDEQGNLLTQPTSDPASAQATDVQSFRRAYEEYLASKAQVMLDKALGAGRAVVKVTAILDMDQVQETREELDPTKRVAKTEKSMSKSSSGSEGGSGTQAEEMNEMNYDVPKVVRTVHSAPGTVKKLDVALVIDPTTTDKDGKEATLSNDQLQKIDLLVKRAVGVDEARKDSFQRTEMPFHRRAEVAAAPVQEQQKQQYTMQMVKYGSTVLAAIIFVAFAGLTLRRAARPAARTPAGPGIASPSLMEADLLTAGGNGGQAQLRNRVKDLIARDPNAAAKLLQRWITEEETKKGKTNG